VSAILFRMPNWVGDAVMALPALEALRTLAPDAEIDVMAHPRVSPLVAAIDWIRGRPAVPGRGSPGWRAVIAGLRRRGYAIGITLAPSFSSAFVLAAGGARRRIGRRGGGRDFLLTEALPPGNRRRSQVAQYVDIVRALGPVPADPPLRLAVPAHHRDAARAWLAAHGLEPRGFVALAPGASYGPAKMWPVERFAETARGMEAAHGFPAVVVGAPGERERLDAVAAAIGRSAHVFDRPNLLDAAALLGDAVVLLSNDTGALHLGRAAGTRVVGLFTSTSPEWTGPAETEGESLAADVPCRPCFRRTCPLPAARYACLEAVSSVAVLASLERQLARRPVAGP
jgi:heptosyltransferase-2